MDWGGGSGTVVVKSLVFLGSDLYAGGLFSSPAWYIAKWDGSSWTDVGNFNPNGGEVKTLAVQGNNLFAGGDFYGGLFYVAKWNGTTWTNLGNDFYNETIVYNLTSLGTDLYAGGEFYDQAGNPDYYLIRWDGSAWSELGSGTDNTVRNLASIEGDLYVGGEFITAGDKPSSRFGIYHSQGVVGVDDITAWIPSEYILAQNYPNPFNPVTTIKYSVPQGDIASIKVYDLLGREVAVLVNEYKPTGTYSVEFNASRFASGVYFYQLQAGNFVEVKKMILLR